MKFLSPQTNWIQKSENVDSAHCDWANSKLLALREFMVLLNKTGLVLWDSKSNSPRQEVHVLKNVAGACWVKKTWQHPYI